MFPVRKRGGSCEVESPGGPNRSGDGLPVLSPMSPLGVASGTSPEKSSGPQGNGRHTDRSVDSRDLESTHRVHNLPALL